jgi:cyclohexadieny/prephenate dehydrogenase
VTARRPRPKPLFQKVALIGVGLIGSSLARALRRERLARSIVGCARTRRTRKVCLDLGIVDAMYADPGRAVSDADLVVICTPIGTYSALAAAIGPRLAPGAIVTDVGSVKRAVIDSLSPAMPEGVHLVPGHPVAGTEHSGPEAGFADLFAGRWSILTPEPTADRRAIERVADMWRRVGSRVEIMDAAHHDLVLAVTSHLPHLIAYNIVGTAADLETVTKSEVFKYSAGGFRDFTRIAASDPVMWRDIFVHNRDAVLEILGRFNEDLAALQRAIRWGQGEALEARFVRTRAIRRGVIEAGQADGTREGKKPVSPRKAKVSGSTGASGSSARRRSTTRSGR